MSHTVMVRRDDSGIWCARLYGGGFVSSGLRLHASRLEDAIVEAEIVLARTRREVPVGPWRRDGDQATTELGKAEHQPEWATAVWTLRVHTDESGRWWLRRTLAEHLAPIRDGLGDSGVSLAGAIRAAATILAEQRWDVTDRWQITGASASTWAYHPADRHPAVLAVG